MAIIIENMEMPNGCCECRMQTENCCTLSLRKIDDIFTRPTWCKLKELLRCRDCKWYRENEAYCVYWASIYVNADATPRYTPFDYCFRRVRKDVEENDNK